MKKQYKTNDLPNSCYTLNPMDFPLIEKNQDVTVILVVNGEIGYWKTDLVVNSYKQLNELNKNRFNITDINLVKILQDFSVFGHYGLLNIINEENSK